MPELEIRYPCPVCLGVMMEKTPIGRVAIGQRKTLLLDHCGRCGGVWFEAGEVQLLRDSDAKQLWEAVVPREETFRMQCHGCHGFIDRSDESCASCGWHNALACPVCQRPMETATHEGVKLDACRSCKGVWFDHDELSFIWRLELSTSIQRHQNQPGGLAGGDGALVVADALMYSPWLVFQGAHMAGHAAAVSVEALTHAPEAIAGVAEVAGEAAGGVFMTIIEILGDLFS